MNRKSKSLLSTIFLFPCQEIEKPHLRSSLLFEIKRPWLKDDVFLFCVDAQWFIYLIKSLRISVQKKSRAHIRDSRAVCFAYLYSRIVCLCIFGWNNRAKNTLFLPFSPSPLERSARDHLRGDGLTSGHLTSWPLERSRADHFGACLIFPPSYCIYIQKTTPYKPSPSDEIASKQKSRICYQWV